MALTNADGEPTEEGQQAGDTNVEGEAAWSEGEKDSRLESCDGGSGETEKDERIDRTSVDTDVLERLDAVAPVDVAGLEDIEYSIDESPRKGDGVDMSVIAEQPAEVTEFETAGQIMKILEGGIIKNDMDCLTLQIR